MAKITFWGVIASPYQLKMQALATYAGLDWQRWPDQAGLIDALGTAWQLSRARKTQSIERYPGRVAGLDEYPSVPYYCIHGGPFYYDSSGLAYHLDAMGTSTHPLLPEESGLRFICQLIDEAFDEFGLYMVHHNRWVTSAATNIMGEVTAREMRKMLPPGIRGRIAHKLPERQVRRCPYLFSVAPAGFDAGVAQSLTAPQREGFPPTHQLLDDAWRRYLTAMETLLADQPFLLGQRFTLADASAYGQLGMNLIDGRAAEILEELAPLTFRWLCMIRDGGHANSSGELHLGDRLQPLLKVIGETFTPLMRQNEEAYLEAVSHGRTLFNEAAFDKGEALYDGSLLGMPFRAVVKTFQVSVWRELCAAWRKLPGSERSALQGLYPGLQLTPGDADR
jgi:glutathione S-transferase